MFKILQHLKSFLSAISWRDNQQFSAICKFHLGDKGSTVVTNNSQLLLGAAATRSSPARRSHTAGVKFWSVSTKPIQSVPICTRPSICHTTRHMEKAAGKDEV